MYKLPYQNEQKEFIKVLGITQKRVINTTRKVLAGVFVTFVPLKSSTVKIFEQPQKPIRLASNIVDFIEQNKPTDTFTLSADSFLTAIRNNMNRIQLNMPRMQEPSLYMDISKTRYDGDPQFLETFLHGVLSWKSQAFYNAQNKYNINAAVLIGIANQESGYGSSSVAKRLNNIGGMRTKKGYIKYDSVEECIDSIASNLQRNYVKRGLKTPPKIGKKYCETDTWSQAVVSQMRNIHRRTQCSIYYFR
jgi:beta-N-acetylglucosaminidase